MNIDHNPQYEQEQRWSLDNCIQQHEETAARQLRDYREEQQLRYRETQYRDFYNKKVIDQSSPVTEQEREFYRKLGKGEIEFKVCTWLDVVVVLSISIFILILFFK